ncbi:hypothetical protein [Lysobacter sp. TY2-98]|uniref:hypothetical protein n=1 Tax=Lysobacter sp. TY2-98 TaxID=2290922 RepID=UPI0013B451AC|nr:hypothetical protein [Lysobacter sp. TY2-98]
MKAQYLDKRSERKATCYLCSIKLGDYLASLPASYEDYEVQREIVSNVYLDHLVSTVLERRHIPPIVLIAKTVSKNGSSLTIENFKILDGLQRTYRLHAIQRTIEFALSEHLDPSELLGLSRFAFSRKFSTELRQHSSNTEILRAVLEFRSEHGADELRNCLSKNPQWFEVWTGLTAADEVRKMLILNAGHKPVKTRHQLELLFLNLLPVLRRAGAGKFEIVREKEVGSSQFSKVRAPGEFHFAHLITAMLSFLRGRPVAASTGLVQEVNGASDDEEDATLAIDPELFNEAVRFLVRLEALLEEQHGDLARLWIGREVTLSGLFAGLGAYFAESNSREFPFKKFIATLKANPKALRLSEFESTRNSLDLSKINIGNVNRLAVFNATLSLLHNPSSNLHWRKYFAMEAA